MASVSKLDYLKKYMSKEERHDFKMRQKVKEKVLANMEGLQLEGDLESKPITSKISLTSSSTKNWKKSNERKPSGRKRHNSESDESPSRKTVTSNSISNKRRHDSDSDQSPPRQPASKQRHHSDFDKSPPRKIASKQRHDSDSDQSPPRKSISTKRHDSDSDQSPPRKAASKHRHDSDSDQSPPRKSVRKASDSDQSPPRRSQSKTSSLSSNRRDKASRFSNKSPSPLPSNNMGDKKSPVKATKTMSGATAGLSSAAEMKREAKMIREKEDKSFQQLGDEILGRNAKTVMRDKETGRKRNMDREREEDEEKERKKDEQKAKYDQWGKGLSQQAEKEKRLADQVHEASKPLARYKDDTDLDSMLRNEQRAEDPMLAFIQRKKAKEDAKNPSAKQKKELPKYKGSAPPPPNRFNILPGYRWDGVDRSNGFESKLFANINNKKAIKEMAYKWSTEDM